MEIRITKKLPISVVGPKTRWIVMLDYWGKNGNKCQLLARCLTNGTTVEFYGGRVAMYEDKHRRGFPVSPGIQEKLACAMVAQGNAVIVQPWRGTDDEFVDFPPMRKPELPGQRFLKQ